MKRGSREPWIWELRKVRRTDREVILRIDEVGKEPSTARTAGKRISGREEDSREKMENLKGMDGRMPCKEQEGGPGGPPFAFMGSCFYRPYLAGEVCVLKMAANEAHDRRVIGQAPSRRRPVSRNTGWLIPVIPLLEPPPITASYTALPCRNNYRFSRHPRRVGALHY